MLNPHCLLCLVPFWFQVHVNVFVPAVFRAKLPPGIFAGCWVACSLVNDIFKYFHIFSHIFKFFWGSPPGMFAGCWGGCSQVNNIFKYFHIFANISWESPPGMFAVCWGGCSLVNNIKGREVEKQTGWMQKTRSQLLRHMFQMESLLLFPPVLRQRFRAGRQFLKRENLSGVEKCWWKNEFQQRQRFRSRSDKWDFESTSKPHCF